MPSSNNFLLTRLPEDVRNRLEPAISIIDLPFGETLAETNKSIDKVYFPESGIISCVVELIGGGAIETGMIGTDSVYGAMEALDGRVSLNLVKVQVAGQASVVDASVIKSVAEEFFSFQRLLVTANQFILVQVQQTAACNAAHSVEQRFCKWLLRMQLLAGDEFHITQEFMAQMMGVRRTSVTEIAGPMQSAGLIAYKRGDLRILDLEGIRRRACECHDDLQSRYDRLFLASID
jgi:CRP-like cAMP-binding protein